MQRAVNIEITLAKIGLSGPDIATALIEMDEEKLTKNKLELLKLVLPDMEETRLINRFLDENPDTNPDELRAAERTVFHLLKLPRMQSRVQCFYAKLTVAERITTLVSQLDVVYQALVEVQHSTPLRYLLQLVLHLGNFMNQTTARGGAVGLRLSTLEKLSSVRASSNAGKHKHGNTLLHIIAQVAEAEQHEALDARKTLPHLQAACAIEMELVETELTDLRRLCKMVGHEVRAEAGGSASVEAFTAFSREFESGIAALEQKKTAVDAEIDHLYRSVGDDPKSTSVQNMLRNVDSFTHSLERAHADLLQVEQNAKRQVRHQSCCLLHMPCVL